MAVAKSNLSAAALDDQLTPVGLGNRTSDADRRALRNGGNDVGAASLLQNGERGTSPNHPDIGTVSRHETSGLWERDADQGVAADGAAGVAGAVAAGGAVGAATVFVALEAGRFTAFHEASKAGSFERMGRTIESMMRTVLRASSRAAPTPLVAPTCETRFLLRVSTGTIMAFAAARSCAVKSAGRAAAMNVGAY